MRLLIYSNSSVRTYENTCEGFHGVARELEPARPHNANIVAIVGATASGKTGLSIELAERIQNNLGIHPEIVPVDTKTTIIEFPAGSAAPDETERRIPHHMLGMFHAEDWVPHSTYQAIARSCMRDTSTRGRLPILVGGSVHFMEALTYFDSHVEMRQDVGGRFHRMDQWALSEFAVHHGLGMPFEGGVRRLRNHIMERWGLQREWDQPPLPGTLLLGVHREPEELRERILARTEQIFPKIYQEWGAHIEQLNGFYSEQAKRTIGYGDFNPAVNKGREPI